MRRAETYVIPKVAIALARDCIIEPQKNITDYRVDSVFVIRDKDFDNIPDICLEIDENGHNNYDGKKEREREAFIRSFGHKLVRRSIKRNTSESELNNEIATIVVAVKNLIKDIKCEYAMDLTEEEFIAEIEKCDNIDIDFARLFARKSDPKFGQFKYHHEDIANFLGHDKADDNCYHNRARRFVDLMKKNLEKDVHYIVDDGARMFENIRVILALGASRKELS